jgi:DNA primase
MRIPDSVLARITDRLDMAEVVSEYVRLQNRGGRLWGLCPFHAEKTPSFTVNPEKSLFYCFGCHKGGSLFTFIMEMEKLSFVEAVRLLAEKAGVEIELEQGDTRKRDAYLELYRRVAGMFHHLLINRPEAEAARSYLDQRGLRRETWDRFQLGYAPAARGWLGRFLLEKKYSSEFLLDSGLFVSGRQELVALFRQRIVFPIINHRNEVLAFGGRTLSSDVQPKYLNSPETGFFRKRENLYGCSGVYQQVRREGSFLLVEGYMDVLALYQAGVENAVAPLGTAVTEEQVRRLKRYASRGLLLFDADEAGLRATERAILICERHDLAAEVVMLEGGKDPAEILEKEGPAALQKKVKYHINGFQFYLNAARSKYDTRSPDGKRAVIRHLTSYLSSIDSQVKRDGYLRLLAEDLGVDFESVRGDLLRGLGRSIEKKDSLQIGEVQSISADLFFLLAVAVNREYFPKVRNTIAVDDLEDIRARKVFVALEECFRQGETTEELLLQRLEDAELKALLLEKAASGEFMLNPQKMIQDGLKKIRRRSLEKKQRALVSALARDKDPVKLKELLAEKMYLDEELQSLKVSMDERASE